MSKPEGLRFFGEAMLGSATPAEFLGRVIQSCTEYSVIVKDLDGSILLWNEGAQNLYGYKAEEVIGQPADILHAPEDIYLRLPQRMRETALKEGRWEGVVSRITKDQLRLTCRLVMTPFVDAGKVRGFVLVSKDISTEFRLRERISQSRFIDLAALGSSPEDLLEFIIRLIQSSTQYSIIGTGVDGRIVLWNEGAQRIYGYDPAEVVGRQNISMLHTEADRNAGLPQAIMRTAMTAGVWEGTVARLKKNGEPFAARVTVTPRLDTEKQLLGFLVLSQPVPDPVPAAAATSE